MPAPTLDQVSLQRRHYAAVEMLARGEAATAVERAGLLVLVAWASGWEATCRRLVLGQPDAASERGPVGA